MIAPQTVQTEILTAQLKLANLSYANLVALQGGALKVLWSTIKKGQRSVNAVQHQYEIGDTGSSQFLKAWTCLTTFVGTYAGGDIDPNSQNPGTVIEVVTPANFLPWLDIPYASFDAGTQQPDGGRYIFNYPLWKGINPALALTSPAETALFLGTDYVLLTGGGFQLLNTGNVPYMYPGMVIRATAYAPA